MAPGKVDHGDCNEKLEPMVGREKPIVHHKETTVIREEPAINHEE